MGLWASWCSTPMVGRFDYMTFKVPSTQAIYSSVLVSAVTELIFFRVSSMMLCFCFMMWNSTAEEVLDKGKKIIHILLKASFAIKWSKVKGYAHQTQFLGMKCKDVHSQIAIGVINKITALSTPIRKSNTSFLRCFGFLHILNYSLTINPLFSSDSEKEQFHIGSSATTIILTN